MTERERVTRQFSSPVAIKCLNDLCSFTMKGSFTQTEVVVSDSQTARLELAATITGYVMTLPNHGVEFCHVNGLTAKKWFGSKRVQGLRLVDSSQTGHIVLALGEEPLGHCPAAAIQKLNRQNQDVFDPSESRGSLALLP